ncbi:MAG: signal peptidase II [Candidatus Nanoarchaeia archaeon]
MKKYFVLLFLLLFIDQLVKTLATNPAHNFGIFLGFWHPPTWFLLIFWSGLILFLCVIFAFLSPLRLSASFLLAGIISQLWDKIRFGYVIDPIVLASLLHFNFADVYIFLGATLMITTLILKKKEMHLSHF